MAYSIFSEIGKNDKKGFVKVYTLLIFNGKKIRIPTDIKINKKYWSRKTVTNGISKNQQNIIIKSAIINCENKLLEAIKFNPDITYEMLKVLFFSNKPIGSNSYLSEFAEHRITDTNSKLSKESIKQMRSTIKL